MGGEAIGLFQRGITERPSKRDQGLWHDLSLGSPYTTVKKEATLCNSLNR